MESEIDLEEAVGSYLNCLSTSCAAGSKLYTSVGKIIDERFQEIFSNPEEIHDKRLKKSFQFLQTQNAFEGYQKALLDCKEKLLELLIESHTKKYQPSNKGKQESSAEVQYASMALRVAKELYYYHQTVADVLKPLVFSEFQEDFDNVTLTGIEGKDEIVAAWLAISEANRPLRHGYGLTNHEISQTLSWQHGEDVSESCRKKLNTRINELIQQYVDRLFSSAVCEVDLPASFNVYPDELQKVLQNCCSPAESYAASSQGIPALKEDIEVMLHRELPRMCLSLNGHLYDKANPGKAFENTTLKMRAVRDLISTAIRGLKLDTTKEQIDFFCLRILAASSQSTSSASARTAVILAFGKSNLLQVKPVLPVEKDKVVCLEVHNGLIEMEVPSKWCIVEDSSLFKSLCRDKNLQPILTVDATYHAVINIVDYIVKKVEPVPIVRITQCVLCQSPSSHVKKEQSKERAKSIKIRMSKATNRLFQRKTVPKTTAEVSVIANEFADAELDNEQEQKDLGSGYNSSSESQDDDQPVPPPRHKRKAKKSRPKGSDDANPDEDDDDDSVDDTIEKKDDLGWYSSSTKFGLPPVPKLSGSKDQSPSIASFEELQGVIDFLSASSSSNLALNEKSEKLRHSMKVHKRNNSMTSLSTDTKSASKAKAEGKLKLCHKKSASFSGKTTEMATEDTNEDAKIEPLKSMTFDGQKKEGLKSEDSVTILPETSPRMSDPNESCKNESSESAKNFDVNSERTPGDGMDNKVDVKNNFTSTVNINTTSKDDSTSAVTTSDVQEEKEVDVEVLEEKAIIQTPPAMQEPNMTAPPTAESVCMTNTSAAESTTVPTPASTSMVTDYKDSKEELVSNKYLSRNPDYVEVSQSEPMKLNTLGIEGPFADRQRHSPNLMYSEQPHVKVSEKHRMARPEELVERSNKQTLPPSYPTNEALKQTLYEPFSSQVSWPVGLGGGKLGGLWSDATLENEKPVVTSEKTMVSESNNKHGECAFTLDKQQDFQKLLEGSRFFSDYRNTNENWKDRAYVTDARTALFNRQPQNAFDRSVENIHSGYEHKPYEKPADPWPISQQQPQRNYAHFPSNSNQFQNNFNSYDQGRNIESLQLPPNPVGPYMRQNREQLLAKQQILEKYARQQKQLQLHQQAMAHRDYRMSNSTNIHLDRMATGPPGMGDRLGNQSNRYDILPDRLSFHRPVNPQRSLPSQMPFGGFSGMQSRSTSDVRMENSGMLQDRMPLLREQNIFHEQFRPRADLFSSQF